MDKDYIIATELWIGIQKIQIEQDKESFEANEKQIKLLMQENNLLKQKINHQIKFTNTTETELNEYKKENQ
jgi:hypothetical protein